MARENTNVQYQRGMTKKSRNMSSFLAAIAKNELLVSLCGTYCTFLLRRKQNRCCKSIKKEKLQRFVKLSKTANKLDAVHTEERFVLQEKSSEPKNLWVMIARVQYIPELTFNYACLLSLIFLNLDFYLIWYGMIFF